MPIDFTGGSTTENTAGPEPEVRETDQTLHSRQLPDGIAGQHFVAHLSGDPSLLQQLHHVHSHTDRDVDEIDRNLSVRQLDRSNTARVLIDDPTDQSVVASQSDITRPDGDRWDAFVAVVVSAQ